MYQNTVEVEMIARKKQMHQMRFAVIPKDAFAIILWERSELNIKLPVIACFVTFI